MLSNLRLKKLFRHTELYLLVVLILLSALISFLNPRFLCSENLFDLLRVSAFIGILALGQLIILISGGIDVSFTAVAAVPQYIMGFVIVQHHIDSIVVAILLPIAIGSVLGLFNAFLVYYTKVHSVIVTIATLNVFHGMLVFLSGGRWIHNLPVTFRNFSRIKLVELVNERGVSYGLSVLVGFWILTALLTWFILRYCAIGRKVYAVGGNPEAARRAGINILRVQLFVFTSMGALAGLASFVQAQLAQIIQPNAIVGRELDILAAAILGGASVYGGSGSVFGVILGVLLVSVIRNSLILLRIPAYWHQVVIGLIVIGAASLMAYQRKMRDRRASGSVVV